MKIKEFIFSIGLIISISNAVAQEDTNLVLESDGVAVRAYKEHCDLKMGYDQEWVLLSFENTNDYKVTLIWDLQMWLDGDCVTCDDPHGEYHKVLELQPGETVTGQCDYKEDNRLWIYSKTEDDQNKTIEEELTDFRLANFQVVKMTKIK